MQTKKTRRSSFKKDLTGKKFGSLTPVKWFRGGKWECVCECGKHCLVDTRALMRGHKKSCGCLIKTNGKSRIKNLKGLTFGHVRVLEEAGRTKGKNVTWKCLCEKCGKIFVVRAGNLLCGATRSCGCVRSYGEEKIADILKNAGVEFATQYTFPDLSGKKNRPLRFDFAVLKDGVLQYLIEYNGLQHYSKVPGKWGESYERLVECDRMKKQYCTSKHIRLLSIKYGEELSEDKIILKNL